MWALWCDQYSTALFEAACRQAVGPADNRGMNCYLKSVDIPVGRRGGGLAFFSAQG